MQICERLKEARKNIGMTQEEVAEKVKKDAKYLQVKTRVIITVAVITLIFGIAYTVCLVIGGEFKDFAQAAAPWVFYGIGLAGVMTYFATMEKNEADSKELEQ